MEGKEGQHQWRSRSHASRAESNNPNLALPFASQEALGHSARVTSGLSRCGFPLLFA